jgi:hypothetical protein
VREENEKMLTGIRLPPEHTTYNIEEEDEGGKKRQRAQTQENKA